MGKLTAADRRSLPWDEFALPGRGDGDDGKGAGSYPIPDANHARAALSRVAHNGTLEDQEIVRRKVHQRFPAIAKHAHKVPPRSE